ncbi:hypothetical protein CI109_105341 [Kwoniella shandongensis]|uniref:Uncharacterized protein n=1 Tax=Kwoniella shandongensis TaxID=1734106 RepID=A0A5M6BQQ2_9TREE|nr:uncharacterized protein CI109_007333 [Kwoniella shandongensis]KAA5524320.1 hypothetical protein CI109_007333 [Kwoniella shandongensis]
MVVPRILPYINFAVASAALSFQVTVLYPWHHTLTEDFNALKAEQAKQLAEYHEEKANLINALHIKLEEVAKTMRPSEGGSTPSTTTGQPSISSTAGSLKW